MRINRDNIQEGYATSVSVSPYHPDFYNWIEPGIQPVVRALVDKGYYPLSSCEGHGIWDNCNVVVAFPHDLEAFEFTEFIDPLSSVGITYRHYEPCDYMEQSVPLAKEYKDIPKLRKMGINLREKMDALQADNCLNKLYSRGSRTWVLVEITIAAGADRVGILPAMWNHWVRKKRNIKLLTEIFNEALPVFEG